VAQDKGCLLIKLQHGVVGMPDRLLVRPHRPDVFIEFKRPGQKPSKIQAHWLGVLRRMGKQAVVVRSGGQFRALLTMATGLLD
jgi:hypothetical protein